MVAARQSRAALALLGWTRETFVDNSHIAPTALKHVESETGIEVSGDVPDQVSGALREIGIILLWANGG